MSYILDRDSKVNCVSRTASGAEYTLTLSDELKIGAVPHGGYVLVCLLSACADFFGPTHPDPITVTGYYLAPTTAGWPAKIRVELIKKGRYSLARAVLSQVAQGGNETQRTMCMATFGNLDKEEGPTRLLDLKNPVAPRATCVSSGEFKAIASNEKDANNKPRMTANMRLLEEQLHDPEVPFPDIYTANPDSGRAESRMWVRSKDRRPVDWRWLVIQADATPVVFRYGLPFISKGEQAWFPTMELSISFKQRPRPGTEWIAQSCVCRTLMNGRHENDTELWDEEGRLLAMSRETALVVPAALNLRKGQKPQAASASL